MHYLCPQCQKTLIKDDKRWHCENKHSFDIAKQGYSNLLLVQNKRSKIPGDDAEMVAARQRFLEGGYYRPLSDAINTYVIEHFEPVNDAETKPERRSLIDAGCGEGYYTSQLAEQLRLQTLQCDITGIDISKFAVKTAAKRNKNIEWFVASSSHLPVDSNSCDALLSLFSPLPEQELFRCLKNNGLLIVASTGKDHLIELREILYDKVNETTLQVESKLQKHFKQLSQKAIQFTIQLNDQQSINDLLTMTPHYWKATPESKMRLISYNELTVSIDINLHRFHVLK